MDYTLTNLNRVEDGAAKFGYGEAQESRFPRKDVDAGETGFAHHRVKPGQRQPFGHRHDKAEEVHLILSGSGRARLDDQWVDVAPMDVLRVSPHVKRAFEAGPDGLEYVVFGTHHEQDGELDHDFWAGVE